MRKLGVESRRLYWSRSVQSAGDGLLMGLTPARDLVI
jgi:hypothetical protein